MEMEMEVSMDAWMDRVSAATAAIEAAVERVAGIQVQAAQSREIVLEQRLAEAEETIVALKAQAAMHSARKTAGPAMLLAKDGAKDGVALEAGALDAALTSLSIEQRIAVKSQLLRAGVLS